MVDFPKLEVKTAEKIAEKEGYPTWSRGFSKTEWYSKESVRAWAKVLAKRLRDEHEDACAKAYDSKFVCGIDSIIDELLRVAGEKE